MRDPLGGLNVHSLESSRTVSARERAARTWGGPLACKEAPGLRALPYPHPKSGWGATWGERKCEV